MLLHLHLLCNIISIGQQLGPQSLQIYMWPADINSWSTDSCLNVNPLISWPTVIFHSAILFSKSVITSTNCLMNHNKYSAHIDADSSWTLQFSIYDDIRLSLSYNNRNCNYDYMEWFFWVFWLNADMSVNSFTIVWPPSCIYKPYNILSYSLFGRLNKNTFCTK